MTHAAGVLAPGGERRARRRRWTEAEKRRIVAEAEEPGSSVSIVARRHDVNANQLFTWRRELRGRLKGAEIEPTGFVPAVITATRSRESGAEAAGREHASDIYERSLGKPAGRMEIRLGSDDRVIVGADVDAAALARVIEGLSRRLSRFPQVCGYGSRRARRTCARAWRACCFRFRRQWGVILTLAISTSSGAAVVT